MAAGPVAMRSWPNDWNRDGRERSALPARRAVDSRPDKDGYGVRYFAGNVADAYLQKRTPVPGYSTVVFRSRHAADPTDLTREQTVAFWAEVRIAARAIQTVFAPCHLNYQILGDTMPHGHVHPRYLDASAPGRPLSDQAWNSAKVVPSRELDAQVAAFESVVRS
jgi:diadenosine tetraphosphate (Ap4A) HIT family hydrolase